MASEREGRVTIAADGVMLDKYLELDGAAIAYEIAAKRDGVVRVIEPFPAGLDRENLGFVGSDEEQPWSIDGSKIVFERAMEAGERIRTGVAARGKQAGALRALLTEPEEIIVASADTSHTLTDRPCEELHSDVIPPETRSAIREPLKDCDVLKGVGDRFDCLEKDLTALRNELGMLKRNHERLETEIDRRLTGVEGEVAAVSDVTSAIRTAFGD